MFFFFFDTPLNEIENDGNIPLGIKCSLYVISRFPMDHCFSFSITNRMVDDVDERGENSMKNTLQGEKSVRNKAKEKFSEEKYFSTSSLGRRLIKVS